jgi:YD repeat-containing protein
LGERVRGLVAVGLIGTALGGGAVLAAPALGAAAASAAPRDGFDGLAERLALRVEAAGARVLLVGVTDPGGAVTGLERYLAGKLAAALTATGRVSLTDDTARQAALAEIRGNLADVIDARTAQAAGRLAGAAWLLKGTAYLLDAGKRAELQLQLVRTETGEYWQVEGGVPLDPALVKLRQQSVTAPVAAPRRPPLNLEMAVIASRRHRSGRDEFLGAVRDGGPLRSNDDLKVHFRTNADAYVYFIWVDTHGKASLQFPSRSAGLDNRVEGGKLYSAPEKASDWYYLDENTGAETLYLVASYEPLADLARLFRQAEAGALGGGGPRELDQLFGDLRERGSAGVRGGPTVSVPTKDGTHAMSAEFSSVRGYTHAIRRLTFRHDPRQDP